MKRIDLIPIQHNVKIGQECEYIEPNITEDCIIFLIFIYFNKFFNPLS